MDHRCVPLRGTCVGEDKGTRFLIQCHFHSREENRDFRKHNFRPALSRATAIKLYRLFVGNTADIHPKPIPLSLTHSRSC